MSETRRVTLPVLLGTLCIGVFVMSTTGTARSPFLLAMSSELQSSLAAIANLVALSAVTWGMASLVAGVASDRFGRRPIMVGAVISLTGSLLLMAAAPTYLVAALAAIWGGFSGGTFSATTYATVADQVPPEQRGRALGWVMTGQSLSLVLGVPLATLIGAIGGWRGASLVQAAAGALLVAGVWWVVPGRSRRRAGDAATPARVPLRQVLTGPITALLASGVAERVCYVGMAVYLPTYLLTNYTVEPTALAVALGLVALGNISGNLVGSQLADRLPERAFCTAGAAIGTSLLAMPLYALQPGLAGSVALGFAYAFINALGRPAMVVSLSMVPTSVRGTVLGLNVTSASIGWIAATAAGGWLITVVGFSGLGLLSAIISLIGAGLALLAWRLDQRARMLAAESEPQRPERQSPPAAEGRPTVTSESRPPGHQPRS